MTEFADVNRVIELLGCSQAMAYKAIRTLNGELKEKGFLTIQGKVNENYLRERYGLEKEKHLLTATKLKQMLIENRVGKPLLTFDFTTNNKKYQEVKNAKSKIYRQNLGSYARRSP